MLRSKPNGNKASMKDKSLNKLTIENKSEYEVKYHATFYEKTSVIHDEKGGNIKVMGVGAGANKKMDYVKGELLQPETGFIPPHESTYITVDDSKKVKLKYCYVGLHDDYTEEERNFTIYDEVWFDQPSPEKIKQIEDEKQKKAEECLKKAEENIIAMPCATTYKHNCTKGGITRQCPICEHFFCDHHFEVNNKLIGIGGHLCY